MFENNSQKFYYSNRNPILYISSVYPVLLHNTDPYILLFSIFCYQKQYSFVLFDMIYYIIYYYFIFVHLQAHFSTVLSSTTIVSNLFSFVLMSMISSENLRLFINLSSIYTSLLSPCKSLKMFSNIRWTSVSKRVSCLKLIYKIGLMVYYILRFFQFWFLMYVGGQLYSF